MAAIAPVAGRHPEWAAMGEEQVAALKVAALGPPEVLVRPGTEEALQVAEVRLHLKLC